MTRFFKITVAYDGTDYVGWQIQPNGRTIQEELQKALSQITQHPVKVIGSGRTDAGVHALAQVASCQIDDWSAPAQALGKALKRPSILPTPSLLLKLAFGEMAEELLLNGQHVYPERLLSAGFEFDYGDINDALADIFA